MRIVTLLGCLAAIPTALGMGHNCNQLFWPHVSPEDPQLYECTLYSTQVISGVTVNIAHYARSWTDTPDTATLLDSIFTAANDSIYAYQKFTTVPDLTFNVVATNIGENAYASGWIPQVGTSCSVSVFPAGMTQAANNQKQFLAHEIYHCVQAYMLKAPTPTWDNDGSQFAPYDWWLDGSADYMSNIVYPKNNEEYEWESTFNTSERIFRQSYAASIFFQWMESQGTAGDGSTVSKFIADQSFTRSYVAERGRLAARSDFNLLFLGFMEADKDDKIEDTDQIETVPELPVTWTVFTSPELNPTATFEIDMKTFTGNLSVISLDQGQTVTISYATDQDQMVMVYQTDSGTGWAEVPNDASNAITIDVPCGDTGMAITFLTICTDDVSTASAIITATQTDIDCSCQPGDFPDGGSSSTPVVRRQASANSNRCPTKPTPPSGSTNGSASGTIDTCLYGNWDLDLDAMTTLIDQVVGGESTAYTVSNLVVTGLSTFTADASNVGNFAFQSLTIDMDIDIAGFGTTSTESVINGEVQATIVYVADGQVSLDLTSASGDVAVTTSLTPDAITFDIGEYFVPEGLVLHYTCSGNSLTLTGFVNGVSQTDWIYYYTRA